MKLDHISPSSRNFKEWSNKHLINHPGKLSNGTIGWQFTFRFHVWVLYLIYFYASPNIFFWHLWQEAHHCGGTTIASLEPENDGFQKRNLLLANRYRYHAKNSPPNFTAESPTKCWTMMMMMMMMMTTQKRSAMETTFTYVYITYLNNLSHKPTSTSGLPNVVTIRCLFRPK